MPKWIWLLFGVMYVTTENEYFVLVLCVRFGFTSAHGKGELSVVKLTKSL